MPHNFVRFPSGRSNPGRWTHDEVVHICKEAGAELEHLWFDVPAGQEPKYAYVLAREGNGDRIKEKLGGDLLHVLHPH